MTKILNIAAYKFVQLEADLLSELRADYLEKTRTWALKGTILLTPEGINLFVAGPESTINQLRELLNQTPAFSGLYFKESWSDTQPFKRMLVKIKNEIIAFGIDSVNPAKQTAPYIQPEEFKQWYEENKDMIVLDARNDYEIETGTFENAVDLNLKQFTEFPKAIEQLPEEAKQKPIVTFCTGGIRCEKAAEYMRQQGFENVYQLEGGILNYFEQCGQDHYQGECFVFDKRVALDADLAETQTIQCFGCRQPLNQDQQQQWPTECPHCGADGEMRG